MAGDNGGARVGAGRPVGSTSALTVAVRERLELMGCDPIATMADIMNEARASDNDTLALAAAKELAKYVAPVLKSVEYKVEGDVKHDHAFSIQFIAPTTNYIDSNDVIDAKLIE